MPLSSVFFKFSRLHNRGPIVLNIWHNRVRNDDAEQKITRRAGDVMQNRRRFARPGPFGLGLPRIIAADFAAVNPLKTVPHVPL